MHIGLISKPHLVDLLRIFDRNKWLTPRIRYASVRSKPELIADLQAHFEVRKRVNRLRFVPRRALAGLPKIEYDLALRHYFLDGQKFDVPKESRRRIQFSICRTPRTLDFPQFEGQPEKCSPPSRQTASAASEGSLELGTRSRPSETERSAPFSPSEYIPTSGPSCPTASEERKPEGSPATFEPFWEDWCS